MKGEIVTPGSASGDLAADLASAGLDVLACFQCGRCSAGCPVVPFFDLLPMEAVRLASWGMVEPLLSCRTIWLCASCETCATRCPNSVDIAGVMDFLRALALERGVEPAEPRVPAFHRAFLGSVRRWGRAWELGLICGYKIRSGDLWGDLGLGARMLRRGRLPLLPRGISGKDDVRGMFRGEGGEGREGQR